MPNTTGSLIQSVNENFENARRVKGEAFANAAQGLFELVQVTHAMAVIEREAKRSGADVSALAAGARQLLVNVSARLIEPLSETDGIEARAMAERLEARRRTFDQRKAKQP